MQYFKEEKDRLVCLLCSYYWKLEKGQSGICGVNKNIGDKIECLVYGYFSALNNDPIEKKPLYHFFPQTKSLSLGTVGCNFKCSFCQNHGISQEKNINKSKYLSPKEVVQIALKNGCKSISYTYNEPTIFYPYAKDIALEAKKYVRDDEGEANAGSFLAWLYDRYGHYTEAEELLKNMKFVEKK